MSASEISTALLVVAWLAINGYFFISSFYHFENKEEYFYTRKMLKSALAWARAPAACLNFNLFLLLLPVCRNLLSVCRGICPCQFLRHQLDDNIICHQLLAWTVTLLTAVHIIAHVFNLERYAGAWSADENNTLLGALSRIDGNGYLNPMRNENMTPLLASVTTVAGITGIVATICLFLLLSSSMTLIRRSFFELFWLTHHLSAIFYIAIAFHGYGRIVRGQTPESLKNHDPDICSDKFNNWGSNTTCPLPQFVGLPPKTWKWILAPMVLYALERGLRFYRAQQTVAITRVVCHPSRVLELRLRKRGFHAGVGQYVFLCIPSLRSLEWHPFTLTSAPEDDYFSVHVRVVGDWTEGLAKVCGMAEEFEEGAGNAEGCERHKRKPKLDTWQLPFVAVDGPFGSPADAVFEYNTSVCIAGGIGVTPFASVLKSTWNRVSRGSPLKLSKIYLFWLCRDTHAFEWFSELLVALESQLTDIGRPETLEYNIFLTAWDENQALHIAMRHEQETDVILGTKQKTSFGRPSWDREFSRLVEKHQG
uniref:Cytochrome b-245 beta chain n=1 Tax=Eptatretus burgeri TaxID=7764 RepID=A0A8C4Q1U1_EPTBU